MLPCIGMRVVRGVDWESRDDDGGEGNVGTVVEMKDETGDDLGANARPRSNGKIQNVTVTWDCGKTADYRTGHDGKYDLSAVDVGSGGTHLLARCDSCRDTPSGFRWYCVTCQNFDLCNNCYNTEQHDLSHQFVRFVATIGSFSCVPTRESSRDVKVDAKGLFVGAKVSKDDKVGTVTEVLGRAGGHERGAVKVQWHGGVESSVHSRKEKGEIDIVCTEPATYGVYYKDHMPKVGEKDYLMVGDLASVLKTEEEIKEMQGGHGDWVPEMAKALYRVGIIIAVTYRGDVKLHFPGLNQEWDFNTEAVTRLEDFGIGDTVRIIEDEELVKKAQPGHGDWKEEMAEDLGKEGTVIMETATGDVKVLVNNHPWTFHPACLTLVRADGQRQKTNWEEAQQIIMLKAMQDQLIMGQVGAISSVNSRKQDIIKFVEAAQQGNLAVIKEHLENNPSWINIQVSRKSALHIASLSGHLDIVKYLVSKDAEIEIKDEKGFRPIHYATLGKHPKILEYLLKQGAYPSAVGETGLSALHLAVTMEPPNCLSILLKYGCNVNMQEEHGETPLHVGLLQGSKEAAKLLINCSKVDLTLRNYKGLNALHQAALRNAENAVSQILDKMPELAHNRKDDGYTPLHVAAFNNHLKTVKLLLDKGKCNMNVTTTKGETPLYLAVGRGGSETVEYLVTRGANINIQGKQGQTAMHLIFELLKENGYEVEDSLTLRKIRASMREIGVSTAGGALACYLAKNGGDMNIQDKRGETPWDAVSDPKLRACLEKCVDSRGENLLEGADAPKPKMSLLSRLLPFLNREPSDLPPPQKPHRPHSHLNMIPDAFDDDVAVSINKFETRGAEAADEVLESPFADLASSPLEDALLQSGASNQPLASVGLGINLPSGHPSEHPSGPPSVGSPCLVCREPIQQLMAAPCQHVQPVQEDEHSSALGAAALGPRESDHVIAGLRRQNSEFRTALSCAVCLQHKKAVVFECGHSTCKQCSELLPDCPVCRKPASKVLPLFL